MVEGKSEIAIAPCHRIINKAGAKYVSEAAAEALAKHLEEYGIYISKIAVILARHAGRSVVKDEDFEFIFRKWKKEIKE